MTRVLPFAVHVYSLWYVCTYKCWGAYFLPSLCSASHSGHTRSAYAGTWAGCSTNVTKLYESLQNSKEQKCNTEHVSYCGPTNVRLGATVPEQPGSSDSCTHAYVCVCVCVCVRARAIPLLHLWAVMVCYGSTFTLPSYITKFFIIFSLVIPMWYEPVTCFDCEHEGISHRNFYVHYLRSE